MNIVQLNLLDVELWKPVVNWENKYEISSFGRLRNLLTQNIISGWLGKNGYRCVTLGHSNKKNIHAIVLESFVGQRPCSNHCCNHIDGNKLNNRLDNLEWVTYSENNSHAYRTGLKKPIKPDSQRFRERSVQSCSEGKGNVKLSSDQVRKIRRQWSEDNRTMRSLGREYNISHHQISNLLKGKSYTWVKD